MRISVKLEDMKLVAESGERKAYMDGVDSLAPLELFIASLGGCVAAFVMSHCKAVGIPHEDLVVDVDWEKAEDGRRVAKVDIRVRIPSDLPENRRKALLRVAEHCTVHNSIINKPEINISIESG